MLQGYLIPVTIHCLPFPKTGTSRKMKILLTLIFVCSSFILLGQEIALNNTWYVEKSVKNGKGKLDITLTLDSISTNAKETTCCEIYNFKNDTAYYNSRFCYPTNPEMREFLPGSGLYSEGVWTLDAMNNLKLIVTVNKKEYVSEYLVSSISARKVLLTEK